MKTVESRARTVVQERTDLMTDGTVWQVVCTCGWKTRIYRREKTARFHYLKHTLSTRRTPTGDGGTR